MKLGLIGKNISYSLSPTLHKLILQEIGIQGEYQLFDIEESEIVSIIEKVKNGELKGINVTVPYKEKVSKYLDNLDSIAKATNSVNTITFENEKLCGYNTDYYGLKETLEVKNINIKDKDVYILGSGGSSKTFKYLVEQLGGKAHIVSRNIGDFTIGYNELPKKGYLMVNATPKSFCELINLNEFSYNFYFDLKYWKDENKNDKEIIDGLYMLFIQGIKAEEIWNKVKVKEGLFQKFKKIVEEKR